MIEENKKNVDETLEQLNHQLVEIKAQDDGDDSEMKDKKQKAIDALMNIINFIKETSDEVRNSEAFQQFLVSVKKTSVSIAKGAQVKFDEFKDSPEVKTQLDNIAKKYNEVYEKITDKVKSNEQFMEKFNSLKADAQKGYTQVSANVEEFAAKPKVKEAIEKGKDLTIEFAEAVDSLIDSVFKKKDTE